MKAGNMSSLVDLVEKKKMVGKSFFCPWEEETAQALRQRSKLIRIYTACENPNDVAGCIAVANSVGAQGIAVRWLSEAEMERITMEIHDAGLAIHAYEIDTNADLSRIAASNLSLTLDTNRPQAAHQRLQPGHQLRSTRHFGALPRA